MAPDIVKAVRQSFGDAAKYAFRKMLMVELTAVEPPFVVSKEARYTGSIGFSGEISGVCILKVSLSTAKAAAARLAGESVETESEISDGVGELVNMIAGNAKATLNNGVISLSFPRVAREAGNTAWHSPYPGFIQLYYESEIGDIEVVVSFSYQKEKA
jgi:chemotaxis protein CheX